MAKTVAVARAKAKAKAKARSMKKAVVKSGRKSKAPPQASPKPKTRVARSRIRRPAASQICGGDGGHGEPLAGNFVHHDCMTVRHNHDIHDVLWIRKSNMVTL